MDVVIITSNAIVYDPRVEKIVKSLTKKCYSVSALGWNRQPDSKNPIGRYHVDLKLLNLKAPEGKPTVILRFPLFWLWIFLKLCELRPKVVHACDLDTVIPSYFYKIIFRKKLLFDLHDRYALAYIPTKLKLIYSAVNSLEELFISKADILLTVSRNLFSTIKRNPKCYSIVMNCPEAISHRGVGVQFNRVFKLVYTGAITRNRGLERIISVINDIPNIEFEVAGPVVDQELLSQLQMLPYVSYKGILRPRDALFLEAQSDVMVILYDLKEPINNFAMPNKLFEAMMCGIPLVTNIASEIIEEMECGILVDYDNLEEIKQAIVRLMDDETLRKRLGQNGHMAFRERYNWSVMETELLKVYSNLLPS